MSEGSQRETVLSALMNRLCSTYWWRIDFAVRVDLTANVWRKLFNKDSPADLNWFEPPNHRGPSRISLLRFNTHSRCLQCVLVFKKELINLTQDFDGNDNHKTNPSEHSSALYSAYRVAEKPVFIFCAAHVFVFVETFFFIIRIS